MIPTETPAPAAPRPSGARAAGPLMAPSPCETTLPAFSRETVVTIAWADPSAAAAASAPAGSQPSTRRWGARVLNAVMRMPSALRSSAARRTSLRT